MHNQYILQLAFPTKVKPAIFKWRLASLKVLTGEQSDFS